MNNNIWNDLLFTIYSFVDSRYNKNNNNFNVYHYTPFDGALSITNNFSDITGNSVLYHTRYDCLSDSEEGKDAYGCYLKAVNLLLKNNREIKNEIKELLLSIKPNDMYLFYTDNQETTNVRFEKGIAYICCFSKDPDSEKLWKIYLKGNKSGFSLGYNVANLVENSNQYFGNNYSHIIKSVLYEEEEKVDFIYNFLKMIDYNNYSLQNIEYLVQTFINLNKYVFKNPFYSFEKEVKSIVIIPQTGCSSFNIINENRTIPYKFSLFTSINSIFFYIDDKPSKDEKEVLSKNTINGILLFSKYIK